MTRISSIDRPAHPGVPIARLATRHPGIRRQGAAPSREALPEGRAGYLWKSRCFQIAPISAARLLVRSSYARQIRGDRASCLRQADQVLGAVEGRPGRRFPAGTGYSFARWNSQAIIVRSRMVIDPPIDSASQ